MDSITQAALGACIGGAVGGRILGRSALVTGALLGTLPDLDVVIDYGSAVANFTQHRGFSHSLFVLIPVGVLLAQALHRWRPQLSRGRWLAFTLLILITHPLLDTLTTYGTQLFWPIGPPLATNSIFIIDPLYTLPLLFAVIYAIARPPAVRAHLAGLGLSSLYLIWAFGAQAMVERHVEQELAGQGLQNAPRMIQPMPFTTLLWRVTVLADEARLEIVTGPLETHRPLAVERFPRNTVLLGELADLPEGQRLLWFTRGFLDVNLEGGSLQATDIRLGLPGVHPFTFELARQDEEGLLVPATSELMPRPAMDEDALRAFWLRLTGEAAVLCLASLQALPDGEHCS